MVALGDNPFGGHFDAGFTTEDLTDPNQMMEVYNCIRDQTIGPVDLLGNLNVSLKITFRPDSVVTRLEEYMSRPLSDEPTEEQRTALGEIIAEFGSDPSDTVESMGWSPPKVGARDATDADYESVVPGARKYILVLPKGTGSDSWEQRCYCRNDGAWRMRDIMTAILDAECHARPYAHFSYVWQTRLDTVVYEGGVVTYTFRGM